MSGSQSKNSNVYLDPANGRYYQHDPHTGQSTYLPEQQPNRYHEPRTVTQNPTYRHAEQPQYRQHRSQSNAAADLAGLSRNLEALSVTGPEYIYGSTVVAAPAEEGLTPEEPDTGVNYDAPQQYADPEIRGTGSRLRATVYGKSDKQMLDRRFKRQHDPSNFFVPGRVIKIPWPEPAGNDNRTAVTLTSRQFHDVRVYEKIRWFIVVKGGYESCICIPIATYGKRGVARRGVLKRHHCIVHTTKKPPAPLHGETPTKKSERMLSPLCVIPTEGRDYMEDESRVNFGKMYTVEFNVRVYDFGMVHPKHVPKLVDRWRKIIMEPDSTQDAETVVQHYTQPSASQLSPHQRKLMDDYAALSRASKVSGEQPDPPEEPSSLQTPAYVDLGEANTDYDPSNDARQISIRERDRLSIIEWPYDEWAIAFNQRTRQQGWVALQYIDLYSTVIAKYPHPLPANPRGYVAIQRGDELRLIESRPDGWSLVWKQETAETGIVPTTYIEQPT